jgi:hypothetical protein
MSSADSQYDADDWKRAVLIDDNRYRILGIFEIKTPIPGQRLEVRAEGLKIAFIAKTPHIETILELERESIPLWDNETISARLVWVPESMQTQQVPNILLANTNRKRRRSI